jgi:hypothetical protein
LKQQRKPEVRLFDGQINLDTEELQAEKAFQPREVMFDVGSGTHHITPLEEEVQLFQGAFAKTAQVVVGIDRSAERIAHNARKNVVEVGCIVTHNVNAQTV